MAQSNVPDDERCWVCLEDFEANCPDEAVQFCQCRLWAHESCLIRYSRSINSGACCPLCRTEIPVVSRGSSLLKLKLIGEGALRVWLVGTLSTTLTSSVINGSLSLLWDLGANAIELLCDEQQSEYLLGGPRNNPFSTITGVFPFTPLREWRQLNSSSLSNSLKWLSALTTPTLFFQAIKFTFEADRQRLRRFWMAPSLGLQMLMPVFTPVTSTFLLPLNFILMAFPVTPFATRLEQMLACNTLLYLQYSRHRASAINYIVRKLQPDYTEEEQAEADEAQPVLAEREPRQTAEERFELAERERLMEFIAAQEHLINLYDGGDSDAFLCQGTLPVVLQNLARLVAVLLLKENLKEGHTLDSIFNSGRPVPYCLGANITEMLLFILEKYEAEPPALRDAVCRLIVMSGNSRAFKPLIHVSLLELGHYINANPEITPEAIPEPIVRISEEDQRLLDEFDEENETLNGCMEFYLLYKATRPEDRQARWEIFETLEAMGEFDNHIAQQQREQESDDDDEDDDDTDEDPEAQEPVMHNNAANRGQSSWTTKIACNLLAPYAGWAGAKCLEMIPFFARRSKLSRTLCALWMIYLSRDVWQILTILATSERARHKNERVIRFGERKLLSSIIVPRFITFLADFPRLITTVVQVRLV